MDLLQLLTVFSLMWRNKKIPSAQTCHQDKNKKLVNVQIYYIIFNLLIYI